MTMKNHSLRIGGAVTLSLIFFALVGPWLSRHGPAAQNLALQFAPPSAKHFFGNGVNGVDLLAQLLWGARLSLVVGLGSVAVGATVGLVLGSMAGYFRGPLETIVMRVVDAVYAFPGILLVVALASILGPGIGNMLLVMSITSWAGYARLSRAIAIGLREQEFMVAAKAQGATHLRIILRHLWPNLLPLLIVQMSFGLGGAIMTEGTLSFLGIGAPPDTPSWGQMINQGREVLMSNPRVVLVPGIALMLSVLGLNLLGDGLRDRLDPRLSGIAATKQ